MYNIKNMKIIEDAFIDIAFRSFKYPILSTIIVCIYYILFVILIFLFLYKIL